MDNQVDLRDTSGQSEEEIRLRNVPRWIEVPVGLLLSAWTLLCIAGSLALMIVKTEQNWLFCKVFGTLMLLASVWSLQKSVSFISGRSATGVLLSPITLRIASALFLLMPIGGLFTGYYKENGVMALVQAGTYLFIISPGLWKLARVRDAIRKNDGA